MICYYHLLLWYSLRSWCPSSFNFSSMRIWEWIEFKHSIMRHSNSKYDILSVPSTVVSGAQQLHGNAAGRAGQQPAGQRRGHPNRSGSVHPNVSVANRPTSFVLQRSAAGCIREGRTKIVAGSDIRFARLGGPISGECLPADSVAIPVSCVRASFVHSGTVVDCCVGRVHSNAKQDVIQDSECILRHEVTLLKQFWVSRTVHRRCKWMQLHSQSNRIVDICMTNLRTHVNTTSSSFDSSFLGRSEDAAGMHKNRIASSND